MEKHELKEYIKPIILSDSNGWIKEPKTEDKVNHPNHYTKGIETYDYITSWNMSFTQGNIIKYVTRYNHKNGLEDLKKAQWYLTKLIGRVENEKNSF